MNPLAPNAGTIAPDATKDVINAIDNFKIAVVNALNGLNMTNIFGNFYANNIALAVVILVVDTFVKITGSMTAGLLASTTFQNNSELVVTSAGKYFVSAQVSCTSAVVAEEIELAVTINGNANTTATAHTEVSIGAITRPSSLSVNGIFNLAVNDVLSLALANHSTTADITIQHVNFSIVKIA